MRESHVFAVAGLLTAFSFIANWFPFFKVPWGMQLDFVGAIWLAAFFLYGLRVSFLVSAATTVLFAFFSAGGWIGAVMKFASTFPMILVVYALIWIAGTNALKGLGFSTIALVLAVAVRGFIATVLNLFAIPIFIGWPLSDVLPLIPEILLLNVILGVVDFAAAYLIVFKSGLHERFAA